MNSWNQALFRFWDRLKLHFPLRRNFLLFLSIALLLQYMSEDFESHLDEEGYFFRKNVIDFLFQVFIRVWLVMILLSVTTLLLSFFQNKKKLKDINNTKLTSDYRKDSLRSVLVVQFRKILRPILGYLFVTYQWDQHIGQKLLVYKQNNYYESSFDLDMPFVKRYHFDKLFLVHMDLFRFFRLNLNQTLDRNMTRRADYIELDSDEIMASQSSDEEQNASHPDRADGEWLRSKKFEPSDDFRRVIWRVYAQSRELVVRRPEIYSPHSSKMNFYVSFVNNEPKLMMNDWFDDWLMTRYKDAAWSLFQDFQMDKDIEVSLVSFQNIPNLDLESRSEYEHEIISASQWQTTDIMNDEIYEPGFFVICISPFISIDNLRSILQINKKVWIYLLVPNVTNTEKQQSWLHRIIFRDRENMLKNNLRSYRWLGLNRNYYDKVKKVENYLESKGTNYTKINIQ